MTYEEVKQIRNNTTLADVDNKELSNMIDEAVKKQIAKKPNFVLNSNDTRTIYNCECGFVIAVNHKPGVLDSNDAPNYCRECGQKLKWDGDLNEF